MGVVRVEYFLHRVCESVSQNVCVVSEVINILEKKLKVDVGYGVEE